MFVACPTPAPAAQLPTGTVHLLCRAVLTSVTHADGTSTKPTSADVWIDYDRKTILGPRSDRGSGPMDLDVSGDRQKAIRWLAPTCCRSTAERSHPHGVPHTRQRARCGNASGRRNRSSNEKAAGGFTRRRPLARDHRTAGSAGAGHPPIAKKGGPTDRPRVVPSGGQITARRDRARSASPTDAVDNVKSKGAT
jgi:hypothetical protein